MKRFIIGCCCILAACSHQNQDGTYFLHFQNEYSVADDTLIIADGVVTKRTGYNKIRQGKLKPREYGSEQWRLNEFGTPVIVFKPGGLLFGGSFYKKIK